MTEFVEQCPICFEAIGEKNNITTECGHLFHASCLMENITHNGFGCPCCRTLMAEHSHDEDSDIDDDSISDDDSLFDDFEDYDEYSLRGLRFFTNLLEDQQHSEEDIASENIYVSNMTAQSLAPSLEFVAQKMKEQGITYEELVANALTEYEEYEDNEAFQTTSGNLWGKIRTIISNYTPVVHSTLDEID
jgi:hypothetical protein